MRSSLPHSQRRPWPHEAAWRFRSDLRAKTRPQLGHGNCGCDARARRVCAAAGRWADGRGAYGARRDQDGEAIGYRGPAAVERSATGASAAGLFMTILRQAGALPLCRASAGSGNEATELGPPRAGTVVPGSEIHSCCLVAIARQHGNAGPLRRMAAPHRRQEARWEAAEPAVRTRAHFRNGRLCSPSSTRRPPQMNAVRVRSTATKRYF